MEGGPADGARAARLDLLARIPYAGSVAHPRTTVEQPTPPPGLRLDRGLESGPHRRADASRPRLAPSAALAWGPCRSGSSTSDTSAGSLTRLQNFQSWCGHRQEIIPFRREDGSALFIDVVGRRSRPGYFDDSPTLPTTIREEVQVREEGTTSVMLAEELPINPHPLSALRRIRRPPRIAWARGLEVTATEYRGLR